MKFFNVIDSNSWSIANSEIEKINKIYNTSSDFPHAGIYNLFNYENLKRAEECFPVPDSTWWNYDNFMEKKWAKDNLIDVDESIRSIVQTMNDKPFVQFLEDLTGIKGLITDWNLNGGGLHQITRGGKLDIHIDYNYHPKTKLDRRLNAILYLNSDWDTSWGGALELWNKDMTQCIRKFDPIFNTLVIFNTSETSNHGHPDPLMCPEGVTRKSIALYYYTNGREDSAPPHSTIYKKRPQDSDDPEQERLRQLRSTGRLTK